MSVSALAQGDLHHISQPDGFDDPILLRYFQALDKQKFLPGKADCTPGPPIHLHHSRDVVQHLAFFFGWPGSWRRSRFFQQSIQQRPIFFGTHELQGQRIHVAELAGELIDGTADVGVEVDVFLDFPGVGKIVQLLDAGVELFDLLIPMLEVVDNPQGVVDVRIRKDYRENPAVEFSLFGNFQQFKHAVFGLQVFVADDQHHEVALADLLHKLPDESFEP